MAPNAGFVLITIDVRHDPDLDDDIAAYEFTQYGPRGDITSPPDADTIFGAAITLLAELGASDEEPHARIARDLLTSIGPLPCLRRADDAS